jgi:hypothetical protein
MRRQDKVCNTHWPELPELVGKTRLAPQPPHSQLPQNVLATTCKLRISSHAKHLTSSLTLTEAHATPTTERGETTSPHEPSFLSSTHSGAHRPHHRADEKMTRRKILKAGKLRKEHATEMLIEGRLSFSATVESERQA